MKLSKLYTNKSNFSNIKFNPGFNVIYADVKTKDKDKNSHNLGKSLLIDVIDFLLLKGVDKKENPLFKNIDENKISIFKDYIFYLEIILNSGKFLTIKRSVSGNSKISFNLSETTISDFTPPFNWNNEEIALQKAKKLLNEYLDFDFCRNKTYDYRKALNYCLRKQGDYQDIYRLTKFKGKDIDWKPFMFDLLGFNGSLIEAKYDKDSKIKDIKKFISEEEKDFDINRNEKDEIEGLILIKDKEQKELNNELDKFNFYNQDKENINILVEEIEQKISSLNTDLYNIEFDINRLQLSVKNKFSFDLNKIQSVFSEAKIYFSDQIKKDYSELLEFNNKLTTERNKLLRETLTIRLAEQKNIKSQLQELNKQQSDLLSYIQDTDVFKKFKTYQKKVVEAESEIFILKSKLNAIDIIGSKQKEIKKLETQLENIVESINAELDRSSENQIYTQIRTYFSQYYKSVLDEIAIISLKLNNVNNIEFYEPKVQNKNTKLMTNQGDGFTYRKLFCVCFDLSLLMTYKSQSFFRFVYHDDVFANQDNRPKSKLLKLIKEICSQFDIQYIFTIIKDEVPYDKNELPIKFSPEELILELNDKDETGTLFGIKF